MDSKKTRKINGAALIGTHVSWAALSLFISTFLIAQLMYETHSNMAIIAIFFLVTYIFLFLFYALFAYIVKKYSSVWCMRIGVVINVLLICLICAFHTKIVGLYLLFAVLNGISGGIYWISFNGFLAETMGGSDMLKFQAYLNIIGSIASVLLPLSLGALIQFVNFFVAAIVAAVIGVILIIFTFIMQIDKERNHLSYRKFFRLISEKKLWKPIWLNFVLQFFAGLFGTSGICAVILIAIVFGDSFSLGYLTSIFSGVAIFLLLFYRMFKSRRVKNNIHLISAVFALLLPVALLFHVNKTTVILFEFASIVLTMIPNIEVGKLQCDVMKDLGHESMTTESLVLVEFAYFLARMVAMLFILLAYYVYTKTQSIMFFGIITVVFMCGTLAAYILFRVWWGLYQNMIPRSPIPQKIKKNRQ